jgi:hypothetical protein
MGSKSKSNNQTASNKPVSSSLNKLMTKQNDVKNATISPNKLFIFKVREKKK